MSVLVCAFPLISVKLVLRQCSSVHFCYLRTFKYSLICRSTMWLESLSVWPCNIFSVADVFSVNWATNRWHTVIKSTTSLSSPFLTGYLPNKRFSNDWMIKCFELWHNWATTADDHLTTGQISANMATSKALFTCLTLTLYSNLGCKPKKGN